MPSNKVNLNANPCTIEDIKAVLRDIAQIDPPQFAEFELTSGFTAGEASAILLDGLGAAFAPETVLTVTDYGGVFPFAISGNKGWGFYTGAVDGVDNLAAFAIGPLTVTDAQFEHVRFQLTDVFTAGVAPAVLVDDTGTPTATVLEIHDPQGRFVTAEVGSMGIGFYRPDIAADAVEAITMALPLEGSGDDSGEVRNFAGDTMKFLEAAFDTTANVFETTSTFNSTTDARIQGARVDTNRIELSIRNAHRVRNFSTDASPGVLEDKLLEITNTDYDSGDHFPIYFRRQGSGKLKAYGVYENVSDNIFLATYAQIFNARLQANKTTDANGSAKLLDQAGSEVGSAETVYDLLEQFAAPSGFDCQIALFTDGAGNPNRYEIINVEQYPYVIICEVSSDDDAPGAATVILQYGQAWSRNTTGESVILADDGEVLVNNRLQAAHKYVAVLSDPLTSPPTYQVVGRSFSSEEQEQAIFFVNTSLDIPAMSGSNPGSLVVDKWEWSGGALVDSGETETVYNIAPAAVIASSRIKQAKKIGDRYVVDFEPC